MLECILLGYLGSTQSPEISIIKNSLMYMEPGSGSSELIQKLSRLGLFHASDFLISSGGLNCDASDRLMVARALDKRTQTLDLLSLGTMDDIRARETFSQKLAHETEYQQEKRLIKEHYEYFLASGHFREAFVCAELLGDQ